MKKSNTTGYIITEDSVPLPKIIISILSIAGQTAFMSLWGKKVVPAQISLRAF